MSEKELPLFDSDSIQVETLLGGKPDSVNFLKGVIRIAWGKEQGQMSMEQARHLAVNLIEAANTAETDEMLVHFLHKKIGLGLEPSVLALREFRTLRKDWLPGGAPATKTD